MKPVRFFNPALVLVCFVFAGCSKPPNGIGSVQADILGFKTKANIVEMTVQVCNHLDHSIFASSEPFANSCEIIAGKKLKIESDFWYPDNVYPNQITCPEQVEVKESDCVKINVKMDLSDWIKVHLGPTTIQELEFTFMYFEREITWEMVRAGYTKNFNELMTKYGKHLTAQWSKVSPNKY